MFRIILLLMLFTGAGQAHADDCPDFYRFVEFGKKIQNDELVRNGPTFRGEGLDRSPLLLTEHTECKKIRELSLDGHGIEIPIVTRFHYNTERIDIDLTDLHLFVVEDTTVETEKNASAHRERLNQTDATKTRGANFLCAETADGTEVSCQIVSPYPGNLALVAYCDAKQCALPIMAMDERLIASSTWSLPEGLFDQREALGAHLAERAQEIHDLLETLS